MDNNTPEAINEIELGSKQKSKLNKIAPEQQDNDQYSHEENMEDDDDLEDVEEMEFNGAVMEASPVEEDDNEYDPFAT